LDALDDDRRPLGDAKQVLPIGSGFGAVGHEMKRMSRPLE
jgi:hypothetical protein